MRKGRYRRFQFSERCGCVSASRGTLGCLLFAPQGSLMIATPRNQATMPPPGRGWDHVQNPRPRRASLPARQGRHQSRTPSVSGRFPSQLDSVRKPVRGRTRLTGVLPSDRVVMLIDMLILSQDEEEREGGEGLRFSTSCLWRKSRHARWMLRLGEGAKKKKQDLVKFDAHSKFRGGRGE